MVPAVDLARTEDRWHSCSAERPGWVLLTRSRSCRARDQSQLRQHGEPAEIAVDPGAAPDFDELAPGRVSEPPITPIRQGVDLIDARIPGQVSGHRAQSRCGHGRAQRTICTPVVCDANGTAVSEPARRAWPVMTAPGSGDGSGQPGPRSWERQVEGLLRAERHTLGVGPLQLLIAQVRTRLGEAVPVPARRQFMPLRAYRVEKRLGGAV